MKCDQISLREDDNMTLTSKVTPARANALKSPVFPSTGVRTKPSLLALMSYRESLCRGPTLVSKGKKHFAIFIDLNTRVHLDFQPQ